MDQIEFMSHIIAEICDYAVENNLEPNEVLRSFADNFLCMLDIATLNGWKVRDNGKA
jgi:hypothetical protein